MLTTAEGVVLAATGKHVDADIVDNHCDMCGEKLAAIITFIGFNGNETVKTLKIGEAVTFPECQALIEYNSHTLQFYGWIMMDAEGKDQGDLITDTTTVTASADAMYRAVYKGAFKAGSLMVSVEYGATGEAVLYATLFVYVDVSSTLELIVQSDTMTINTPHKFEIPGHDQVIYMYKIPLKASDISAGTINIYLGNYLAEEIQQVLFSYADALKDSGLVEDKENAALGQEILNAQQELIDAMMKYGGAVRECFNGDSSYVNTTEYPTISSVTLSEYKSVGEDIADKDGVLSSFFGAAFEFDTFNLLRYYFDVSDVIADGGTITKFGVIVSDEVFVSQEGLFQNTETAKFYEGTTNADKSEKNTAAYMATTDQMNINEIDDKYAIIYVEYTKDGVTESVYGDVMVYGIERYLKKQVYDYSPNGGQKVVTSERYDTMQYLNLLLKMIEANKSAKALDALRASNKA